VTHATSASSSAKMQLTLSTIWRVVGFGGIAGDMERGDGARDDLGAERPGSDCVCGTATASCRVGLARGAKGGTVVWKR
jgi:hypothetical protein